MATRKCLAFGTWGRYWAMLAFLLTIAIGFWQIFDDHTPERISLPLGLYEIFIISPALGFVEFPHCCRAGSCIGKFSKCMSRLTGWWAIRAILYIALSAGGYAIYVVKKPAPNGALLAMLINLNIVCVLYLLAFFTGQPNPYYSDKRFEDGDRAAATPLVAAQTAPAPKRWNPFNADPSDSAASAPAPAPKPKNPFAADASAENDRMGATSDGAAKSVAEENGGGRSWLFY